MVQRSELEYDIEVLFVITLTTLWQIHSLLWRHRIIQSVYFLEYGIGAGYSQLVFQINAQVLHSLRIVISNNFTN